MKECSITFDQLQEAVLSQLKEQGYMDSTLLTYRRIYDRIRRLLIQKGLTGYSAEVGKEFLLETHVQGSTMSMYSCAVRRLDDYILGKPYQCHHSGAGIPVPQCYTGILDGFLTWCRDNGNRSATIKGKQVAITRFLQYLRKNDCQNLEDLDVSTVSRALLIFDNKDDYSRIRQFLRYLTDAGITSTDLAGIVPTHRRKKNLPSAYSVDEIIKLEQSIDPSTEKGLRDRAMILLATRMGLRSGDIAKLKYDEIDFLKGNIQIIQEKTLVPLSLKMPDDVMESLHQYLKSQARSYPDGYVFHSLSAPYGKVTTSIIRHAVNQYLTTAGIDIEGRKHGPHALRSSLASSMVNDGAAYETVRRILGHTDPNVIKHYARSDVENLRRCAIEPPIPSGSFADYLSGKKVLCRV